eukprot:7913025-Pyramimonas_sp.AAC.1
MNSQSCVSSSGLATHPPSKSPIDSQNVLSKPPTVAMRSAFSAFSANMLIWRLIMLMPFAMLAASSWFKLSGTSA